MSSNPIPETHLDLLERPLLAHTATIGPKGEPQSNPVWYLYEDGVISIAIGPTGQKFRNLQRDPRIALSIADPENPIHYLEIRGNVTGHRTVGSTDPLVIAMIRKYTGNDAYDGMPEVHTIVAIEPVRCTTM